MRRHLGWLVTAVAAVSLIVAPVAHTSGSPDRTARASASVEQQVKKLKQQVKKLKQQLEGLSQQPGRVRRGGGRGGG